MIRHICFYTLTQAAHDEGVDEVVKKLDDSVKNMVGNVPGLICARVAKNLSDSERDLLFYSEFESMDDIPPYLISDVHRAHAEMGDRYVTNRITMDAEF